MLKPHLQRVYDFIIQFQNEHDTSPTSKEIAAALGYADYKTPNKHVRELELLGYIKRYGDNTSKRIKINRSSYCDANV